MNLDDLKEDIAKGDMRYRGICHDCGAGVFVEATLSEDGTISISGGAVYKIKRRIDSIYFFKCDIAELSGTYGLCSSGIKVRWKSIKCVKSL
jgi:hypothetical protein